MTLEERLEQLGQQGVKTSFLDVKSKKKTAVFRLLRAEIEEELSTGTPAETVLDALKSKGFDKETTLNQFYQFVYRMRKEPLPAPGNQGRRAGDVPADPFATPGADGQTDGLVRPPGTTDAKWKEIQLNHAASIRDGS